MNKNTNNGAGLRGQVAGQTSLCTVGKTGSGLSYRGYDISILAEKAKFEEVAYLLLHGGLPNQEQLNNFLSKIISLRNLPQELKDTLEKLPPSAHPMDVLRTGCSMLGNLEPETSFDKQAHTAVRILSVLPSIICYWYCFSHEGKRISTSLANPSIGGHFLEMLLGKKPSQLASQVMNVSLILYAEHEFNASTFTARVCASTLSDMYSCVTGAIGSLRGNLHGGANEAAMEMIQDWQSPDEAEHEILKMLDQKKKIMGFGHAIYEKSDPRNPIIKKWAEKLAEATGDTTLYPVSLRCEEVMWREKQLFCNADFFHASAYHLMDIPTKLFTPIFVMSRIAGWTAHIIEQRANNRIIRPSAEYTGPSGSQWLDIDSR